MEKKSNHLVGSIICGILTALGIVASIISLATGAKEMWMVNDAINGALAVLIGYYAFSGYQKPHGNLLKYIFLISTATHFVALYQHVQLKHPLDALAAAIIIGLICYIAGRLHRVKQNIILMSIVATLILIGTVVFLVGGISTIGGFTALVIWIDIFVAYVLRYKEHKEAGLTDAPKK